MFLVVSDSQAFIETWKVLLPLPAAGSDLLQARCSLADAIKTAEKSRLTLAIVDGSQLGRTALAADGELARLARQTRLLLVKSKFGSDAELAALALGVVGCCAPELSDAELRKIVDVVLKGGIWISRSALPDLLQRLQKAASPAESAVRASKLDVLTPREREIARCVADGATNKLVAKRLSVSDVTVKAHLTTIFQKLGVSGRVQLALLLSDQQAGKIS